MIDDYSYVKIPVKTWSYPSANMIDIRQGQFAQKHTAANMLATFAENFKVTDTDGDEVLFRNIWIPSELENKLKNTSEILVYRRRIGDHLSGVIIGVFENSELHMMEGAENITKFFHKWIERNIFMNTLIGLFAFGVPITLAFITLMTSDSWLLAIFVFLAVLITPFKLHSKYIFRRYVKKGLEAFLTQNDLKVKLTTANNSKY